MDSTIPKVSFIPKGSLVRETSFLERRRPQSAIGFIAGFVFVASVGSYAGLYFYSNFLEEKVVAKTDEINLIQQKFSDAPQISKAQVFRSRAELARELLDNHTVVSPVLTFLSENTIESILYEKFSFARGTDGAMVELTGEAPTYMALAYQGDILRKKTKELSKFEIGSVSLTEFGTVTFTLSLAFMPGYLSYSDNLNRIESTSFQEGVLDALGQSMGTSTISNDVSSNIATSTEKKTDTSRAQNAQKIKAEAGATTPPAEKQPESVLKSIWSRFKFW